MLKGKGLTGKGISAYNTGEELDRVEALISHPLHNQVVGFTVHRRGLRRKVQVLPWSGVHAVTPNGVVARSQNMIVEVEQIFEIKQLLDRYPLTPGIKLMTTNGYDLGIVTDIYFDARTGTIEGYEVSGGRFTNAAGFAFVPALGIVRFNSQIVLLPPSTLDLMKVRGSPGQQGDLEAARGYRVLQGVQTEDGWWIAAPTQVVTSRVIDRARRYHKERELLDSIGFDAALENEWKRAEKQTPVLPQIDVFLPVRARKQIDERRIKRVLGQVARQTVADQHGIVIITAGERVTPQAILNAKRADMLEILLLSAEAPSNSFWLPQVPRILEISEVPLD